MVKIMNSCKILKYPCGGIKLPSKASCPLGEKIEFFFCDSYI
jgi:hypothetical protein